MEKTYNHLEHEENIYHLWEEHKAFAPSEAGETYTIMMPPPNANDPLHIGHAMFVTVEDVLIRYNRMKGRATLWLPGTDHAGIETQFVFEKKLAKEGKSRFQFDRETLYQMIWDYVQENSDVAVGQLKKIGASADWDRFTFMLEPKIVKIVLDTFKQLHDDGLIYRAERLVNYCTKCGTAFSELEIEHEERVTPFFTMKYGPFEIGTVRPETKFRDTALAVHPEDKRFQKYLGQTFEIVGLLGPVTMRVIADPEVDPAFGTGIMKVTPAHDAHDFELGKKYDLPVTPIIGFDGKMDFSWYLDNPDNTEAKYRTRAEKYHGLKVARMREVMKADLEEDGLLTAYNPTYTHSLSVCYRCHSPIEPLPMPQFFVTVKPLTAKVLEALDKKEVQVYGAGHDKILRHWLTNLRDWNISRQIVWGIRMPVWYKIEILGETPSFAKASEGKQNSKLLATFTDDQGKIQSGNIAELLETYSLAEIKKGLQTVKAPKEADYVVSLSSPGEEYLQETDTFDTWFSSAQWPYTTLMAGKPGDFERFYPTQVMETGYDILPFWVMRMLMMGLYKTGKLPFTTVYLHGLVRDERGQKMSKSKGNVINPLSVIEKYGADALRMALVMSTAAGKDSNTGETKIRGMRNLTNKIWNAARYILLSDKDTNIETGGSADTAFNHKLSAVVTEVSGHLEAFRIGLAAETAYYQFWHWFCDEAIEQAKMGKISKAVLLDGLQVWLKLLHPFVPFVSEAVWQILIAEKLWDSPTPLILAPWPAGLTTKK